VLVALAWHQGIEGDRTSWGRAVRGAGAGALAAGLAALALRAIAGPELPAFVPPEEGAGPGMALGLSAGVIEETLFRLLLLPALLDRTSALRGGRFLSIVITGLAFAGAHEVGPTAGVFSAEHFTARFLGPGIGLSLIFVYLGPPVAVIAHCTAHVALPFLFT